ncbi:hypothetical protein Hanom_Chr10g00955621 [Helianthus anomalus]
MYVCIGVCEGMRLGLGGCGRTMRTWLWRRQNKGVEVFRRRQGDGHGDKPHTFQSNKDSCCLRYQQGLKERNRVLRRFHFVSPDVISLAAN